MFQKDGLYNTGLPYKHYQMHGKLQKAMTDIFRIYHVNQIIDELKGLQE